MNFRIERTVWKQLFRLVSGCLVLILTSGCFDTEKVAGKMVDTIAKEVISAPKNIVLISIDTLRANRLGAYGHPDGYTPTMDRLAALGHIQKTAYTVMPHTTPAHASMLTGLYPYKHGSRDNAIAINDDVTTLADILSEHGYSTAGSVGHFLLSAETSSFDSGFDDFRAPAEPGMEVVYTDNGDALYPVVPNDFRPWRRVNRYARNWLSSVSKPWFLFLHYYECHAPYEPENPWKQINDLHPYDGEIAGIDRAIDDVLRMISLHNDLSNTEVIITSDHGESLGEHGYTGHGINLHTQSMHIPWISTGNPEKTGVQTGLRQIMDIKPTILADRNIPVPAGLDGVPDTETVNLAFGESPSLYPDEPQRRIRSVRDGEFTLIHHRNAGISELFKLETDPAEKHNAADRFHVRKQQLTTRLDRFVENDTHDLHDPEEVLRPEVKDALRALGYLSK